MRRWPMERQPNWIAVVLLLAVLLTAGYVRLWELTPPSAGVLYAPDTDEGTYAFSAQLFLQGQLPYRDFFATMPPGGMYMMAAVLGLFYRPWGSLEGFMALRYATVVYGVMTILVVYAIGRRLGGWPAGLLAAAVLAVDGIVVGQDRRAMLETPMNLFSALAVWAYLEAALRERASRRWLVLAGAFSTIAVMIKSPGAVVPLLLAAVSVLRRRWRELVPLAAGGAVAGLLAAGPFLVLCPEQFLKQVYVFQMVRPPDGVISVAARLREIWGYPYSWLALRLWGLGMPIALWRSWRRPAFAGWLAIVLWAGGVMALIIASRSYWGTYYPQLALPLAVLAGGTLAGTAEGMREREERLLATAGPLALALFVGWGIFFGHFATQFGAARAWLRFHKPAFAEVARYLMAHAGPADAVLATDPLYGMLASRPLARAEGAPYLADSYGGMLYQNLGLAEMGWKDILELRRRLAKDPQGNGELATSIFHLPPAQTDVLSAFTTARYVVIDRRAERQWAPATLEYIRAHVVPLMTVDDATLYQPIDSVETGG
ncbi:MAG: ArnT family glycosyltransferase [Anaerolineae bacterium]